VIAGRERRSRAGLVVVFQEVCEPVLEVQPGKQMLTYRTRVALAKAVVAKRSSSTSATSAMSSSVARRPRARANSVNQTRVLIW
jgi:hypothetical protein